LETELRKISAPKADKANEKQMVLQKRGTLNFRSSISIIQVIKLKRR
jgi:hypothetical protein